jgi:hypothetical protein
MSATGGNRWKLCERKNFHKDVVAWEEYLLQEGLTFEEAQALVVNEKERILFAFLPSLFGGMDGIIWNSKYAASVRLELKYARAIG